MPGFDYETFPFVLVRDSEAIYVVDCRKKNWIQKLFKTCPQNWTIDSRMVMWYDAEENIQIITIEKSSLV